MKKPRIILAMLLAVMMSVALFGCTGSTQPPESAPPAESSPAESAPPAPAEDTADELSGNIILAWWGNPTRNEQTTEVREMFQAANPGVSIEELTVGWADYWTQLATLAASNDLPDVIQMDISTLEEYVGNGQLMDLTPLIESGQIDLSNVPEAVVGLGRVDGGIYAVSIGQNAPAMIYNKTLMDELGIDVPNNLTIDQFVEISKKVYEDAGIRTNFALSDPSNPLEFLVRGDMANMWVNPAAEMFQPFFELVAQGASEGWGYDPASFIGRAGVVEQDPLIAGGELNTQSWVTFGWSNGLTGLQAAAPEGVVLAMAPYPSHNPANSNYVRASMYFSIAANTDNVDVAAGLVNFWTNNVDAHKIMLGERGVPASAVVVSTITPDMSEVGAIMLDYVSMVTENSTIPYALRPAAAGEINSQLRLVVDEVAFGTITPADAAASFAAFAGNLL